ncbi:IclR family acetate operon transcriptional repressor [Actinoalloteichus hoggarensis]|uniref:HTH-type transcriptional repressor AllR n=1 Tax=Actinoalloteichus hoggarensis TaxID=1470176 RepID=A0A221W8S6_9PSEU|nr:IclR family transcriptional regulator [Actinoalloteichus hoggarensis]ASO21996.1 HTH-type transcriptional repressor AllR [Actinoalloteichus hoggarensis]MBB5923924.1 IclR family acetate operon transcriptional repressor [Actinoalloteichus hoggarensis]
MTADKPMQVVVRALDVLTSLAESDQGRTLQDLHEELNIPLGSLHRLLATLLDRYYVSRSPVNKRYFLGPSARKLGGFATSGGSSLIAPPPALAAAAAESGETVFATEMIGREPVCVALVEARHPLRLFVRIGQEMPLHAAAASRSILAFLPEDVVRPLLESTTLTGFTTDTPRTVDDVMAHLKTVRAQGYDVCSDELDRNVWAVAAPVIAADQTVTSSVTLAAASSRMTSPLARTRAIEITLRTARELSLGLGWSDDESPVMERGRP